MDSPYGIATDPLPYLVLSYGIGIALIFGYGIFLFMQHGKLKQMRQALKEHDSNS